ncbi:MAG: CinA family protein [Planctomycetaceae bacterium]
MSELHQAAERVAALLERTQTRIVFAESCTGGLVSATLTRVPGVSAWHCGSAVVYQSETKHRWLGISRDLLEGPGPVSPEVAGQMATRVLADTPHADVAAAVTGHLGPNAPEGLDGLVYLAVAVRGEENATIRRHVLDAPPETDPIAVRLQRQSAAAVLVFSAVEERLRGDAATE